MERGRFELIRVVYKSSIHSISKKCVTKKVCDKCVTIKCHKPVVNIRFFSEMAGFEPAVDLTQHFLSKEAR